MKRLRYRRGLALMISCMLAVGTCFSGSGPVSYGIVSYAVERPATINATSLNVRSGAGTAYPAVAKLSYGTAVTVIAEQTAADGVLWYQIRFSGSGGAEALGFASSAYIKFPVVITNDGDFEQYMNNQGFPDSYKQGLRELHAMYPKWTFTAFQTNLDWNTVIQNESVIGRNLVHRDSISSWKSTAVGAYDWNTGTWPGFDGSAWVQASDYIIRYYMDPRNFLNDKYIYQFLRQSYDSSIHTREGLESMVSGTFLAGYVNGTGASGGTGMPGNSAPGVSGGMGTPNTGGSSNPGATGPGATGPGMETTAPAAPISMLPPVASVVSHPVDLVTTAYGPGMSAGSSQNSNSSQNNSAAGNAALSGSTSYVDIILNSAIQSGVNPYILASMIIQEQGSQGTGGSISGNVAGYQGYYNFFNIEAYQSGSLGAVERGLWWASQAGSYERPWNSQEKSILGGSIYYGNNYVKQGQNTLYLKKFNVQGNNLYKHQYMTNVQAAASEGASLSKISALKNTALEFSIPVFKNMPATASAKPAGDGNPNNTLSGLSVDGFALTPTFNRDVESYNLIVSPSVASLTVSASVIDSAATVSGTGTVNLQSGNNDITVAVRAGNGSMRNYVIHVVRQSNGPTYSQGLGGGGSSGNVSAPGTSGGGPGGGSQVEIISPPGTVTGGGNNSGGSSGTNTSGPIAPDGSGMGGFGSSSNDSTMVGPNGNAAPGVGNQAPGGPTAGPVQSAYQTIAAGTAAAQLIQVLQQSSGGNAKVYTPAGGENGGLVGTGNLALLFSNDGSETARYEMIVKGDNNGDGRLNVLDILKAQRHILGLETLSGVYAAASDVNGNNKIDVTDILAMQKDVLGIQKLQ